MAADTAGMQGGSTSTAADDLTHQLVQLQQWLQSLNSSSTETASLPTPSAFDAQLAQLRRAAAALTKQHQQQTLSLDSTVNSTGLQAVAAAVGCVEQLTQALLAPPPELYSGLSGAPCAPAEGLELAGEQHQLLAAAHLELLQLLLGLFAELPAPPGPAADEEQQQQSNTRQTADSDSARNKPRYFEGIVEIVELPPDTDDADNNTNTSSSRSQQQQQQKQLQQQLVQVLLAAALYAADSSTHMLPCEQPAASAAAGVPELHGSINTTSSTTSSSSSNSASVSGLSYVCGSIVRQGLQLNTPWSGSQCQLQAQQLLQHFVSNIRLPANTTSSSKGARGSQQLLLPPTQQQPQADAHSEQQQQQLVLVVCHMFPLLLDQLRDTLLAQHRHRKLQDKGADMVTYNGPPTFARCLAARQLAWLVQQLQPSAFTDTQTLGLLLPLVLAVADDPSASVRQYGHAAMGWLGLQTPAASLRWQGDLLREEARRLVVGCEESCWVTAMPAATSLILALEGQDQRSPAYHSLVLELLQEADRSAHKPQPRLVFMCCLARLVPRLGLYTVRHLAALMPLLLEWVHAYDKDSSVVALQLLGLLVQYTWPRMSVHVDVVRQHVQQALAQERVERGHWGVVVEEQQQRQQEEQGDEAGAAVDSRRYAAGAELLALLDSVAAVPPIAAS